MHLGLQHVSRYNCQWELNVVLLVLMKPSSTNRHGGGKSVTETSLMAFSGALDRHREPTGADRRRPEPPGVAGSRRETPATTSDRREPLRTAGDRPSSNVYKRGGRQLEVCVGRTVVSAVTSLFSSPKETWQSVRKFQQPFLFFFFFFFFDYYCLKERVRSLDFEDGRRWHGGLPGKYDIVVSAWIMIWLLGILHLKNLFDWFL